MAGPISDPEDSGPYLGWKVLSGLAALAVLPYLRALWLPALSDDHLQVLLSRQYGPFSGWAALLHDPLYRSRATSLLITHWTDLLTGFNMFAFHLTSVAVHIVNTWLVLLLGVWRPLGWRRAAVAAGFFAIYEGHQEAVIWYAALPELLVFTFVLVSFLCWVMWFESDTRAARWLVASLAAFLLALYSKESGVALVALLLLPVAVRGPHAWTLRENWKTWAAIAAFGAAAAGYFAMIYLARAGHQHFNDGTFSLQAPFWTTEAVSTARLFWFWGLAAVIALLAAGGKEKFRLLALGLAWIWICFLPYSFLTYMNRVPSRHTYLASAGLAWIAAAGYVALRRTGAKWLPWVAATAVLYNAAYIWTRKHSQFLERAAPIGAVVRAAKAANGPVYVHGFPYPFSAAEAAAFIEGGKPLNSVRQWTGDRQPGILWLDKAD